MFISFSTKQRNICFSVPLKCSKPDHQTVDGKLMFPWSVRISLGIPTRENSSATDCALMFRIGMASGYQVAQSTITKINRYPESVPSKGPAISSPMRSSGVDASGSGTRGAGLTLLGAVNWHIEHDATQCISKNAWPIKSDQDSFLHLF